MKGFKLGHNGDVVIENNDIAMVDGDELIRQTVQTVIGTNTGEWFFNPKEGINFDTILTKNPIIDAIKDEIVGGLIQVDDTFLLDSFDYEINKPQRKLFVKFMASNREGRKINGSYVYEN